MLRWLCVETNICLLQLTLKTLLHAHNVPYLGELVKITVRMCKHSGLGSRCAGSQESESRLDERLDETRRNGASTHRSARDAQVRHSGSLPVEAWHGRLPSVRDPVLTPPSSQVHVLRETYRTLLESESIWAATLRAPCPGVRCTDVEYVLNLHSGVRSGEPMIL
jgi:hypothetical protein